MKFAILLLSLIISTSAFAEDKVVKDPEETLVELARQCHYDLGMRVNMMISLSNIEDAEVKHALNLLQKRLDGFKLSEKANPPVSNIEIADNYRKELVVLSKDYGLYDVAKRIGSCMMFTKAWMERPKAKK